MGVTPAPLPTAPAGVVGVLLSPLSRGVEEKPSMMRSTSPLLLSLLQIVGFFSCLDFIYRKLKPDNVHNKFRVLQLVFALYMTVSEDVVLLQCFPHNYE